MKPEDLYILLKKQEGEKRLYFVGQIVVVLDDAVAETATEAACSAEAAAYLKYLCELSRTTFEFSTSTRGTVVFFKISLKGKAVHERFFLQASETLR